MTNLAIEKAFGELDIPFKRANVGDRYVLELLVKNNWQLGGEGSGHIVCLDKHTTGDGIISALQVLYALRDTSMTLAEFM
jgi:phosphoglucosamine mutase